MLRDELTPREYWYVGLLCLGWQLKDIADYEGLNRVYVRRIFFRMYEKSGAADKLELALRYVTEHKPKC